MELKLLPEDIDKFIKEAFIKSALGKNIEITIDKAITEAINGYNSPIKELAKEMIRDLIREQLNKEEYKTQITNAIVEKITPQAISDMLNYGIEKMHNYVTSSY